MAGQVLVQNYIHENGELHYYTFDAIINIPPSGPLVEICDNGIDDDGDGNIDCADNDCTTSSVFIGNDTTICNGDNLTLKATITNCNPGLCTGTTISANVHIGNNVDLYTPLSRFNMKGGSLTTAAQFKNTYGIRFIENVCLSLGSNLENQNGSDYLFNTCAKIGMLNWGVVINQANSTMHLTNCNFHLYNGPFENNGDLIGTDVNLWIENNHMINYGNWNISVNNYCADQLIGLPAESLLSAQNCNSISNILNECLCH